MVVKFRKHKTLIGLILISGILVLVLVAKNPGAKSKDNTSESLGPETEAFFDEVEEVMQLLPPGAPMEEDTSPDCDLDGDLDCDGQPKGANREVIERESPE